ncbi:PQQ-dependent dehydrogenase, methanol/ethanol family [Novosphingobium sp.]|uniref:PQQ-dependent dehydrogenase, methanol/ethanol family n=1 Tax=Novosphingobium sp. TaxID=1874826 RepID=UPI003D102401
MKTLANGVLAVSFLIASLTIAQSGAQAGDPAFGNVSLDRVRNAATEPGQWFAGGRDAQGTYFSPLTQINADTVSRLGFAWALPTGSTRGLESTPIVVDGVMYTSSTWGDVFAADAVTGRLLWRFDAGNDGKAGRNACCDIVNRGVAVRGGQVFVGTLDGRMVALDARTGKTNWSVDSIVDHAIPYTITGAPQLTRDAVVIGNGGADMGAYGSRGYVTAFDLKTGKMKWRFYTVPRKGDPNQPPELIAAEKTWDPDRSDHIRGGGTVWDGMSYDPELNLLYLGVGNSSPYQRFDRSPKGGDNLYISSMVAVNPDTGQMVWHYQTTPGDNWDFTAVQKMILADLTIDGHVRKVIMQAPKNGFFYVLDRATGKPISANNYVHVNWTKGLDANFKPIPNPVAVDYEKSPKLVYPSWAGGHSWQPMSYSPQTGLVYIPVREAANLIVDLQHNPGSKIGYVDGFFKTGMVIPDKDYNKADYEGLWGNIPDFKELSDKSKSPQQSILRAWDPVHQRKVWDQVTTKDYFAIDGGVMSTASGLVFEGLADGELRVSDARTGQILKSIQTGSAMMAAPMTYMIGGMQYVAIMAGYGGTTIGMTYPDSTAPAHYLNEGRIIVFKLGGGTVPTPPARHTPPFPAPTAQTASATTIQHGSQLFASNCSRCHQFGVGLVPDLRRMDDGTTDPVLFRRIVLEGLLAQAGMGRFDDVVKPSEVDAIHAYLIDEGRKAYEAEHKPS